MLNSCPLGVPEVLKTMSGWVGAILNSVTNKSVVHLLNINQRIEDLKCSGKSEINRTKQVKDVFVESKNAARYYGVRYDV